MYPCNSEHISNRYIIIAIAIDGIHIAKYLIFLITRGDSMLNPPLTISVAFVHGLLSGLRARDEYDRDWFIQAGIPLALLKEPSARVTVDQYEALYRVLVTQYNDEGLGFFSRKLKQGSFEFILRNVISAERVDLAVRRLSQGYQLLQDDVMFDIVQDDHLIGIRVIVPDNFYPDRVFIHELLLRVFSRVIVWLYGKPLRPAGFDFSYPRPPQAGEYHKLFPGIVRFDQPWSAIWFDREKLTTPLRRDEQALIKFFSQSTRNVVIPQRNTDTTSERIRTYLQQVQPLWPDLPTTANALNISISTLQRHLSQEESTFQMIKDHLRRDYAIMRLNTSTIQLAELATELGFSDQAVFYRAFKQWTGSAPGAYRQGHHI